MRNVFSNVITAACRSSLTRFEFRETAIRVFKVPQSINWQSALSHFDVLLGNKKRIE